MEKVETSTLEENARILKVRKEAFGEDLKYYPGSSRIILFCTLIKTTTMLRHWAGDRYPGRHMAGSICPGRHSSGPGDIRLGRPNGY